jgi:hypothetical protein
MTAIVVPIHLTIETDFPHATGWRRRRLEIAVIAGIFVTIACGFTVSIGKQIYRFSMENKIFLIAIWYITTSQPIIFHRFLCYYLVIINVIRGINWPVLAFNIVRGG